MSQRGTWLLSVPHVDGGRRAAAWAAGAAPVRRWVRIWSIATAGVMKSTMCIATFAKDQAEARRQPMVDGTVMDSEWHVYRYVPEPSVVP